MTLAVLIPAAGNSSRLGQPKQLVDFQGQPLLSRQITLSTGICNNVYCVLGANADIISEQINHAQCHFLYNQQWQQGLAHSIAFGISQLPNDISAVMILLADQWALNQQDLTQLITQWQAQPDNIHASQYRQQIGVPAIFPQCYFAELTQLSGKNGAKQLLFKYQTQVTAMPIDNAAVDLDTPEQLNQLKIHTNQNSSQNSSQNTSPKNSQSK